MSGFLKKKSSTKRPPLILISPSGETKGAEFGDDSISLSETYQRSISAAGGLPLILSCISDRELVAESVRRCDGILLTGGDDINPKLYTKRLAPRLAKTVTMAGEDRDLRELVLIDEIFRQHKPLLAICRGHQLLNVGLGGTLVVDIRSEIPDALTHWRFDKKSEIVHEARLTADSLLAKITGKQSLGVNSTHHQAVGRVASPLRVTGRSLDGIVEAMELRLEDAHLLPYLMTVQFHPERLAVRHPEHQALFNSFTRACVINRNSNL